MAPTRAETFRISPPIDSCVFSKPQQPQRAESRKLSIAGHLDSFSQIHGLGTTGQ